MTPLPIETKFFLKKKEKKIETEFLSPLLSFLEKKKTKLPRLLSHCTFYKKTKLPGKLCHSICLSMSSNFVVDLRFVYSIRILALD